MSKRSEARAATRWKRQKAGRQQHRNGKAMREREKLAQEVRANPNVLDIANLDITDLTINATQDGTISVGGRIEGGSVSAESLSTRLQRMLDNIPDFSAHDGVILPPSPPQPMNPLRGGEIWLRPEMILQDILSTRYPDNQNQVVMPGTFRTSFDGYRYSVSRRREEGQAGQPPEFRTVQAPMSSISPIFFEGIAGPAMEITEEIQNCSILPPLFSELLESSRIKKAQNLLPDLDQMQAKVARAQKLLQDTSQLLSRVVAGLEITPDEAKALKARVDAGVAAFQ